MAYNNPPSAAEADAQLKESLLHPPSAAQADAQIENCCICLSPMRGPETLKTLACHHTFHLGCIRTWLAQPNRHTCPMCRTPILLAPPQEPMPGFQRQLPAQNPQAIHNCAIPCAYGCCGCSFGFGFGVVSLIYFKATAAAAMAISSAVGLCVGLGLYSHTLYNAHRQYCPSRPFICSNRCDLHRPIQQ